MYIDITQITQAGEAMNYGILISIGIYMAGMLFIGYFAYRRTSNLTDYMLGGRNLGPAVTALSAGASDMSGWLLMKFCPVRCS